MILGDRLQINNPDVTDCFERYNEIFQKNSTNDQQVLNWTIVT
jgi:hypothetical protein